MQVEGLLIAIKAQLGPLNKASSRSILDLRDSTKLKLSGLKAMVELELMQVIIYHLQENGNVLSSAPLQSVVFVIWHRFVVLDMLPNIHLHQVEWKWLSKYALQLLCVYQPESYQFIRPLKEEAAIIGK